MENAQRKREILDVCLATFIRRGLYETSVRDLIAEHWLCNQEGSTIGSRTRTMWW